MSAQPRRALTGVPSHAWAACACSEGAGHGVLVLLATNLGAAETLAEETVGRLGKHELKCLMAAVLETPTRWHRKPLAMAFTQVVGVRVSLASEVVEPRDRTAVLVGEGHRSRCSATGARAVTCHVKTVMEHDSRLVDCTFSMKP